MATTYIQRTPSTTGTPTKFTYSVWFKRANLGAYSLIGGAKTSDAANYKCCSYFNGSDRIQFEQYGTGLHFNYQTQRQFRDTSAWYHLVVRYDSTDGTAGDRIKMYINGVEETAWKTETDPGSSQVCYIGSTDDYFTDIGNSVDSGYFDGCMSHIHFIDGTVYDASAFGEVDATSGIWKIKTSPSVTYGTNGFFLKMEDSSNLDLDSGTNAFTNFTTNGELTSTKDNPSNNFCAINPLWTYGSSITINDAGTNFTGSQGNAWRIMGGSLAASTGKYYYEVKINTVSTNNSYSIGWYSTHNLPAFDGAISPWVTYIGDINGPAAGLGKAGTLDYSTSSANSQTDTGWTTYTTGDTICCAIDLTNNFMYWGIDGVWMKSGDPTSGSTGTGGFAFDNAGTYFWFPAFGSTETASGSTCHMASNFGQGYFGNVTGAPTLVATPGTNASNNGIFEYDVPTGYTALCTEGLTD